MNAEQNVKIASVKAKIKYWRWAQFGVVGIFIVIAIIYYLAELPSPLTVLISTPLIGVLIMNLLWLPICRLEGELKALKEQENFNKAAYKAPAKTENLAELTKLLEQGIISEQEYYVLSERINQSDL